MESFAERNREEYDNGHNSCNKDNCSGAYWLGGLILFIIILALLWWFGCNIGAAFVIALILAIIVGWVIYAWETYDNDSCNDKKKKKKCSNNGWSAFLGMLAVIIVWIVILYIVYLIVRKAIVDEKCCPTPCKPKCEVRCDPCAPKCETECKKDC
jgi:uncharacterized membrane-anchored protein